MKNVQETLELDLESLKKIQTLAKDEKRTIQDEAAYFLEKGICIFESAQNQTQTGGER